MKFYSRNPLHMFNSWKNRTAGMKTICLAMALILLAAAMPAAAANTSITIFYNGVQKQYEPAPRIINDRVLVPMRDIFEDFGAELDWDSDTRTVTAYREGKYVSVKVGSKTGVMADAVMADGNYQLSNSRNVTLDAAPTIVNDHTMVPLRFVSESLGASVQWIASTRQILINTDGSTTPAAAQEMRGAWMSFNDLANFNSSSIDAMLDEAVDMNLNTVYVHARAFSDAFYRSRLFPWSHKLTGVQGQAPGIDPLQYVVNAGHQRGLRVEAWINPYRISNSTELTYALAASNPAVRWQNDPAKVIRYEVNGQECMIYNPASQEVRNLISDGIMEIIDNYDVDGIHFDDYFYVTGTGEGLDEEYKKSEVNKLVRQVYTVVKAKDPTLSFGISPAGNIGNCLAAGADVESWLSQEGYVDYVCPQIYWTNEYSNVNYQFDNVLNNWLAMKSNPNVKMYVGLALYRCGTEIARDPGWLNRSDNLMTQVQSLRGTGQCSGFILFDISYLLAPEAQGDVANLRKVL